MIEPATPGSPANRASRASPTPARRRGWSLPADECTLGLSTIRIGPTPALACRLHGEFEQGLLLADRMPR